MRTDGCRSCGAPLSPGARYCSSCGTSTSAPMRTRPFLIAAVVLLAIAVPFAFWYGQQGSGGAMPPAGTGMSLSNGGAPAPSMGGGPGMLSSDMRSNADRLFDRIMRARAAGDEAEAARFLPMAIQAYDLVEDLDADGRFHQALLYVEAGQPEQAARTAGSILAEQPDHLLALGAAAEAALATGDSAAARRHLERLLAVRETEMARALQEYRLHEAVIEEYAARARELTGT